MNKLLLLPLLLGALFGCSKKDALESEQHDRVALSFIEPPPRVKSRNRRDATPTSMLAYEHTINIRADAETIPRHLANAQAACVRQKFGACSVLVVNQQGGDNPTAALTVRIAPTGVEQVIAIASQGAEIESRSSQAEDLAVVVQDNAALRDRLEREHKRLGEFQERRDLAVADMIALSRQLAEVEAQLQASERESAQHQRRLETNLLTLHFFPHRSETGQNEIVQAFRDVGGTVSSGTAWTIRALAFLIPLLFLLVVLVTFWRLWRRRR